jgi:ribosomal 50S subunit-associated protein YjgA (DUF615 family)
MTTEKIIKKVLENSYKDNSQRQIVLRAIELTRKETIKDVEEMMISFGNIDFFEEKVKDLLKQAQLEKSHYYTESVLKEMLQVIDNGINK